MSKIQISLEVADADTVTLCEIFGVNATDETDKATALLEGITRAALAEYLLLATAQRNPSTMRDLRELRLKLLASHLPGHLPSDEQIAEIFQFTQTQARTLVKGTRARYRQELEQMFREAAKAALTNAKKAGPDSIRIDASDSLASYLDEIIRFAPPPTKRTDATHRYDLTRTTVQELCEVLDLPITEVKNLPPTKE